MQNVLILNFACLVTLLSRQTNKQFNLVTHCTTLLVLNHFLSENSNKFSIKLKSYDVSVLENHSAVGRSANLRGL